jgi:hypothetical protein
MAQTHKFKVSVTIKDNHGITRTIYPIIEAQSDGEARKIAEAQYPNGRVGIISKV